MKKIYLIIYLAFLVQLNCIHAQNNENIDSLINIYFNELQYASATKPSEVKKNYFPIYEPYFFQDAINTKKLVSGGMCTIYLNSEKLELMKKIYVLFSNEDTTALFSLIDSNRYDVKDLREKNCGGIKEIGSIDTMNQSAIRDLIDSYNKWFLMYKKNGLTYTKLKNITPTSFSKYKWIKELGYISSFKSDTELIELYKQILDDSSYAEYFINGPKSRFNLEKIKIKEKLYEIMILSLLNNVNSFTSEILIFKLIGQQNKINEVAQHLFEKKNSNGLLRLLKEKNIDVIYNYTGR